MKYIRFLALLSLVGCSGTKPDNLGVDDGRLLACPSSPNCVSSFDVDEQHQIEPLNATISEIKRNIENQERVSIISETDNYLYAEYTSKLMGFVDDVEFYYDPQIKLSHVRSASRLGKSDLGVNRKRIEALRLALEANE